MKTVYNGRNIYSGDASLDHYPLLGVLNEPTRRTDSYLDIGRARLEEERMKMAAKCSK